MRTTITLDERLLAQLKRQAAESGTSVSRLIDRAVRLSIRTPVSTADEERFEPITFGAGGRFSRHNIDKASALLEAEDVERYGAGDQPCSCPTSTS